MATCRVQASCGGKGTVWALSRPEGEPGPRETHGKARALAEEVPVASPGSYHGAWSYSPRPRLTSGECLLQTPRAGGHQFLHRDGDWSSGGTEVEAVMLPSWGV